MGIIDDRLSSLLTGEAPVSVGSLQLFDDLDVGLVLFDEALVYRYLNRPARAICRNLVDDPLGESMVRVTERAYGAEASQRLAAIFRQVLATGEPHHQKAWALGDRIEQARAEWYDWSVYRLRDKDGARGLIMTLTDVSEHVALQARLAQREGLLATVTESAPVPLAYVGPDQRYIITNQAYRDLLGLPAEDIIGRHMAAVVGEDGYRVILPTIVRALAGERASSEDDLPDPQRQTTRRLLAQCIPVATAGGVPDGFVVQVQDVTDRRRQEAELRRQNRDLEEFARVAAHDLQAPLRHVSLLADLLQEDLGPRLSASDSDHLTEMVAGLDRMGALVRSLLDFARSGPQDATMVTLALREVLDHAVTNLTQVFAEREVDLQIDTPLPMVYGEPTLLTQLFQNLLSNSIKFCDQRPCIQIGCRQVGGQQEIRIRDNGIGIPPEQRERIFTTFARLHEDRYPGTGLGLASCRKTVELHGGRIWVEAAPEQGTVVVFTLPVLAQVPA